MREHGWDARARKPELSVLVLAAGGNVSEGILKALGRSALRCRVVGADISGAKMGLYTVDRAVVSPWAHEPGFVEWLIATCRENGVGAVLSGAEPVLRVLSQNSSLIEAETGAKCVVSDLLTLDTGDDKLLTSQWLEGEGFAGPAFCASEDGAGLARLAAAHGYPLVGKPRRGGGCRGHVCVENGDDLDYVGRKPGYIVQQYVGTSGDEFTAGCFADRDGVVRGSIVMRRELHEGTTVEAELGEFSDVRDAAVAITGALRPMGPCNIQMRRHGGRVYCIEINVRFSGTTPVRAWFGFNEVEAALRHYVLGEPCPEFPLVTRGVMLRYWNEMYVMPEGIGDATRNGLVESPRRYCLGVETYGMPDGEP